MKSLDFSWEMIDEKEKAELAEELRAACGNPPKGETDQYFKVEWEKVPELVEQRRALLKRGVAYVPVREQMTLVISEYTRRLDDALEVSTIIEDMAYMLIELVDCSCSSTTG